MLRMVEERDHNIPTCRHGLFQSHYLLKKPLDDAARDKHLDAMLELIGADACKVMKERGIENVCDDDCCRTLSYVPAASFIVFDKMELFLTEFDPEQYDTCFGLLYRRSPSDFSIDVGGHKVDYLIGEFLLSELHSLYPDMEPRDDRNQPLATYWLGRMLNVNTDHID